MSTQRKQLFRNFFWEASGKFISLGSLFFTNLILANYLKAELYGSYSYIVAFAGVFLLFSDFGLERIEIRETVNKKNIIESSLLIRSVASILSYIILVLIVYFFESNETNQKHILIYALVNFASITYVFKNFYIGKYKNIYSNISLMAKDLFSLFSKLILIYLKADFETILYVSIIDFFMEAIFLLFLFKKFNYKLKWNFSKYKILVRNSFPLLVSTILIFTYKKLDLIIVNNFLGDFETGNYGLAQKLSQAVLVSSSLIILVYGPVLNKSYRTPEYEEKKIAFLEIVILVSTVSSLIFYFAGNFIITLLFSEDYANAIDSFKILILKNIFETLFLASGYIIIIEHLQNKAFIRNLIAGLFSIATNLILVPKFGIKAASIVSLITYFLAGFICNYFIKDYRHINKSILTSLKFSFTKQQISKLIKKYG